MVWDVDPVFWRTAEGLELRYYALLFWWAIGTVAAATIWLSLRSGVSGARAFGLFACAFAGAALLSHVTHVVFYEPWALIHEPVRLVQIGSGQSSHGGLAGGLFGAWLYARRDSKTPLAQVDTAMCAAMFGIPFFRFANFANSEIVGRVWSGPWAVAFPYYDCVRLPGLGRDCDAPLRHPSQLYEAAIGVALIAGALYLRSYWRPRLRGGVITLVLLCAYFGTRFLVESRKRRKPSISRARCSRWANG